MVGRWLVVLLFFMIGGPAVEVIAEIVGAGESKDVVITPIFEEMLKLLIALFIRRRVFEIIFVLALLEFAIIKLPLLTSPADDPGLVLFALCAVLMHTSTAFVYDRARNIWPTIASFLAMTCIHISYNSLDHFFSEYWLLLVASVLVGLTPLLWLKFFVTRTPPIEPGSH